MLRRDASESSEEFAITHVLHRPLETNIPIQKRTLQHLRPVPSVHHPESPELGQTDS